MTDSAKPSPARKLILWIMAGLLLLMFLSSVVFRLDNPNIRVQNRQAQGQGQMPPQGMMGGEGNEDMAAIGKLMEQMRENPEDPALLAELGHRLMMLGDFENSEVFLARAMAQNPTNGTVVHMMAVNLFEQERYQESAEQFDLLLALEPDDVGAHFNLAMLYKHYLNRPEEAVQHFQAVLDAENVEQDLLERTRREMQAGAHEAENGQKANGAEENAAGAGEAGQQE